MSGVELGSADWDDVLRALLYCELEYHAPLTPARGRDLYTRVRDQLSEPAGPGRCSCGAPEPCVAPRVVAPSPLPLRFAVSDSAPLGTRRALWLVVDVERNAIVATWETQTAADADAWHRNRLAELEAGEDRDWGLRR